MIYGFTSSVVASLGTLAAIAVLLAVTGLLANWLWKNRKAKQQRARLLALNVQLRDTYAAYTYRSLVDLDDPLALRIIELLPAESKTDDLCIRLYHTSLTGRDAPTYEAISYCWGDASDTYPVFTTSDDDVKESILWVTRNLSHALRRLRLSDRPRRLWADAICINQEDNEEKSVQVRMMADVYRAAEQVVVWLGEQADDSELIETFAPRLVLAEERMARSADNRFYTQLSSNMRIEYGIPSINTHMKHYVAILNVMFRPWFDRVWVVQEVAVAGKVVVLCGTWELSWSDLMAASKFASEKLALNLSSGSIHRPAFIFAMQCLKARRMREEFNQETSLSLVLEMLSDNQATDPRDKVFALLALAQGASGLEIDYKSSVEKVYRDTAVACMGQDQWLSALASAAVHRRSDDLALPSWVTDWRGKLKALPFSPDKDTENTFRPTQNTSYMPEIDATGTRLRVSGYEIGEIAEMGQLRAELERSSSTRRRFELERAFGSWAELCGAFTDQTYDLTGEPMLDAYRSVLVAGLFDTDRHIFLEEMDRFEAKIRIFGLTWLPIVLRRLLLVQVLMWVVLLPLAIFYSILNLWRPLPTRWETVTAWISAGRRMIKTRTGSIGLAGGDAKPGDRLFLLEGGKLVYILRETGETGVYTFIGDAYIRGYMEGTMWNWELCRSLWLA